MFLPFDGIDNQLLEKEEEENAVNFINNMYDKNLNTDLCVGDNVEHDKFGKGVVVQIDGSIAKIAFKKEHGIKMLAKNHKSLHKVNNLF